MSQLFTITQTFLDGALKGLTIDRPSKISFEPGKIYGGGHTGSRYRVDSCQPRQ